MTVPAAPEYLGQVTFVCWVLGLAAVPLGFFGYAFSAGIFSPPVDRLRPSMWAFWVVLSAILTPLISVLVGSTACLVVLLQTGERFCPSLNGSVLRPSNYGYWLFPAVSLLVLGILLHAGWREAASRRRKDKELTGRANG
jgi:hypothetical protein